MRIAILGLGARTYESIDIQESLVFQLIVDLGQLRDVVSAVLTPELLPDSGTNCHPDPVTLPVEMFSSANRSMFPHTAQMAETPVCREPSPVYPTTRRQNPAQPN